MDVDFLIVAALKDEAAEIARLLTDVGQEGPYIVGKVRRWKERGEYSVAIVNLHDGMGALESGPATQGGIARFHPLAVLLTGIAAGFEDSRAVVRLGDLMVPCGIVNYDLAKIKADGVEHRGIAWAVSESLWQTAATTASDQDQPWLAMMTAPRPGGLDPPRIHATADSVLGCGEKVVAAEEAEVRRWLLATYPRQVLGLEMESSAALRACRCFDTPFLVAKASVDKATVEKDDRWRAYTCQLSAAFIVTVLQRYEQPQVELFVRHLRECDGTADVIAAGLPRDDFGYKILTAVSFEQLRQGIYEPGEKGPEVLFPNDLHPNVALYGGGGAGKTTIMHRLFRGLLSAGYTPVLIDLKRYSQEYAAGGAEDIDSILNAATSPRRTSQEIEQLAGQGKLALLIDGVNEVSKTALASVLAFCQELRRGPGCYAVWANRMTLGL
jgi:nucleoside phosphorylase